MALYQELAKYDWEAASKVTPCSVKGSGWESMSSVTLTYFAEMLTAPHRLHTLGAVCRDD